MSDVPLPPPSELPPPAPRLSPTRMLTTLWLTVFATSLFFRAVDPIIPQIAADLNEPIGSVALLATAFALPYALMQPILGALADVMGKTRMMFACLVLVTVATFAARVRNQPASVDGDAHRLWHRGGRPVSDFARIGRGHRAGSEAPGRNQQTACWCDARQPPWRIRLRYCYGFDRVARCVRLQRVRGGGGDDRGLHRVRRSWPQAADANGFQRNHPELSRDLLQSDGEVLFWRRVYRRRVPARHVSVRRAATARSGRDARVHCRHRHCGVRRRRHHLFIDHRQTAANIWPESADDRRRRPARRGHHGDGAAAFMAGPTRNLHHVRLRVLSAARRDPDFRHRTGAERAFVRGGVSFDLLLHRTIDRSGILPLRISTKSGWSRAFCSAG